MTDLAIFITIVIAGFGMVGFAVLVSANTSMGGTRSDYDDGSGCIAQGGVALIFIGLAGLIVEWLL